MEIPLSKEDLDNMREKVELFIRACGQFDSLGRVYAWGTFRNAIDTVKREEEIHSYTYPSPHNPQKEEEDV